MSRTFRAFLVASVAAVAAAVPSMAAASPAYINQFNELHTIASMVPTSGPAMGDQNQYGVAVVRRSVGKLVRGDILVSNFNNSQNQQGTGSSIMEVSPIGNAQVFAVVPQPTDTPAVGLTTALVVLRSGFVVVGSLPAPGGMARNARAGALTVLDANGDAVETITGGNINGPWDMTAVDHGDSAVLFVTSVLNGTVAADGNNVDRGTVVRITLRIHHGDIPVVTSDQVIANGFVEHTDPNALVVGPTGVGLGRDGVLYVADSNGNRIAAIPDALTRTSVLGGGGVTVSTGGFLLDPLGLTIAPNGDIISANGANGRIVETTPGGSQIASKTLVDPGAGDLFGIALVPHGRGLYLVDDAGTGPAANSLQVLQR